MAKPDWTRLSNTEKIAAVNRLRVVKPPLTLQAMSEQFRNCTKSCITGVVYRKRKNIAPRPRKPIAANVDPLTRTVLEAIQRSGRTQKSIAGKAGYDDRTIVTARQGHRTPSARTLSDLLLALDARIVVLLPGEEMPKDTSADG